MTLPFRRRHHDSDAGHDRARSLMSEELLAGIGEEDEAWLTRHVEACAECRRDRAAYRADHDLLRTLRDKPPEPPRDLWARTAAALDREARTRPSGASAEGRRGEQGIWRAFPLGAAAGAIVLIVVMWTSGLGPTVPPSGTPAGSLVAVASPPLAPTPIAIEAASIGIVRTATDGSLEIVFSKVDAVCPHSVPDCRPPIESEQVRPVRLDSKPSTMAISPDSEQLIVEPAGESGSSGHILAVPVPKPTPTPTEAPTQVPATPGPPTTEPSAPTAVPSDQPSLEPSPEPTPAGQVEIASGVTIVGDLAYSEDGAWLAFSARPIDGSTGPDLYLWAVGSPSAIAVTSDHRTYFSTWLGNRVLASRIEIEAEPAASGEPAQSDDAGAALGASEALVGHPVSFVLDPATTTSIDLGQPDVWLPVVDAGARVATYWSGTLESSDGISWAPDAGQLVIDGWRSGDAANGPAESTATEPEMTIDPAATPLPIGPAGSATPIVPGPTGAFRARFDRLGTRLAVWVAEQAGDEVGRLHLLVVDPATGTVGAVPSPLQGEPALSAFSIDDNRLAWVTPSGQDGQPSAVKVLGWSDTEFGEIQTGAGQGIYIVR
jgi:hypothetical protein